MRVKEAILGNLAVPVSVRRHTGRAQKADASFAMRRKFEEASKAFAGPALEVTGMGGARKTGC